MPDSLETFRTFLQTRLRAAEAFVNGDPSILAAIATEAAPATFFGPQGDWVQEPDAVLAKYKRDAALFESGATNFEVLHLAADETIAYWAGLQHATAQLRGSERPVTFRLRVTELFRKENGKWMMVHRHADSLKT